MVEQSQTERLKEAVQKQTQVAQAPAPVRHSRIQTFEDGTRSFDYRVTHFGKEGKVVKHTPYWVEMMGDYKYFRDEHDVYNADGTPAEENIKQAILAKYPSKA